MPKPPTRFVTLNDATSLSQPVVGAAFDVSGTYTFGSGKHRNCCYYPANTTNYQKWTWAWGTYGTVQFWVKLNGWSISGATTGRTAFWFGHTTGSNPLIYLVAQSGYGLRAGFSTSGGGSEIQCTSSNWSADTWYRFALTWDFGGSSVKMYQNDSEIQSASFSRASSDNTTTSLGDATVYAGSSYGIEGYIECFQIFDYAKTSFKDMFSPRASMNDNVLVA